MAKKKAAKVQKMKAMRKPQKRRKKTQIFPDAIVELALSKREVKALEELRKACKAKSIGYLIRKILALHIALVSE